MNISFSKTEGHVLVTVMRIEGDIDAASYIEVINKAQEAYDTGVRDLLLDLTNVPYVSSAGLMSLHAVVNIFSGHAIQSKDGSRPTFKAINKEDDMSTREHVKLFNPQPPVEQVLEVVGLKDFFDIHTDFDTAVNSF